jgi:hypothetical protein
VVRLKADGSLDLDWQAQHRRKPWAWGPLTAEDYEDIREEVISEILRDHPGMIRKQVTDEMEFYGF